MPRRILQTLNPKASGWEGKSLEGSGVGSVEENERAFMRGAQNKAHTVSSLLTAMHQGHFQELKTDHTKK